MLRERVLLVIVLWILTVGSMAAQSAPEQSAINAAKLVDLTYTFDESTIYWPTASSFQWQKEHWAMGENGKWYAAAHYAASEHGGTHIDAPIHFSQQGMTVDQVPVSHLVAPAVVIDITQQCAANRDYLLSAADVSAWEKRFGPVPKDSIVLVRTGWGDRWPDKKRYMGTDVKGDTANLHFPGIGADAAQLLVQRGIYGVGIDTASMDYGQSKDFKTHQVINGANLYGLENVAHLDRLPIRGATLIALPMRIGGGSGAPTRIVGLLP